MMFTEMNSQKPEFICFRFYVLSVRTKQNLKPWLSDFT
jgi:hypothetical protein